MSEVAAAPAVAWCLIQQASKAKSEKKPRTSPRHPVYGAMIKSAIKEPKDRRGASKQAILKFIVQKYEVPDNEKQINARLRAALKRGLQTGLLTQATGSGAAGRLRLAEKSGHESLPKAAKKPKTKRSKPKPKETVPAPAKEIVWRTLARIIREDHLGRQEIPPMRFIIGAKRRRISALKIDDSGRPGCIVGFEKNKEVKKEKSSSSPKKTVKPKAKSAKSPQKAAPKKKRLLDPKRRKRRRRRLHRRRHRCVLVRQVGH
ncbi:hypothetical protein KIN20_002749 [Parelaphostrongylus tenuis]|uniref:H15 domain-containing protein n=1 Tax=Parelaphostrongylus tenuis TaxID=148309 RepID=A0AAD5QD69_PARTN|nr:hypothetical protein KIN20_002749 [Parelaphostrongylus tenuis]